MCFLCRSVYVHIACTHICLCTCGSYMTYIHKSTSQRHANMNKFTAWLFLETAERKLYTYSLLEVPFAVQTNSKNHKYMLAQRV